MAVYNEKNKNKWTKDGRHWYFRCYYKDINGKYKHKQSKMFRTKQEAVQAELEFLSKNKNPLNVEFSIVANSYLSNLSNIRKASTVYSYKKDYKNHIEPYFNKYYLSDINIKTIGLWAETMNNKSITIDYKNKIYNILCNILDYAIKEYGFLDNPARIYGCFQKKNDQVIKDAEKLRYLTYDEFNRYISFIDDIKWKTFFVFAYYTGCRRGEIQALTWKDINFNTNEIYIDKTLYEEVKGKVTVTSTKNNLNRKIKMSRTLITALLDYKKEMMTYTNFDENWFVFGNTRFLPKTTIDRNKDYYFKISGVRRITMHEFRHSHVSLLINEYVKNSRERNMKVDTAKFFLMMSNRMGHTIQIMQDTYMHLFPTIQDEIVEILDNL